MHGARGGRATPIVNAATREVLIRYQAAQVGRVKALLAFRAAERFGEDTARHREQHVALTEEVAELERAQRIPFAELCRAFELPARLRDALVVAAAPHLDEGVRDAIAHFWRRDGRRHVDGALIVELTTATPEEAIAAAATLREQGPLQVAGLVESLPVPLGHATSQLELELAPTPRLLRVFDGEVGLDPRFRGFAQLLPAELRAASGVVSEARFEELAKLVRSAHAIEGHEGARLLLAAAPGSGKLRLAQALAAALGTRQVLVVESAFLPAEPTRLMRIVDALAQEAEILGAQLVFRRIDKLVERPPTAVVVRRCLSSPITPIWCTSDVDPARSDAPHLADLAIVRVTVPLPDTELRRLAWRAELARAGVAVAEPDLRVISAEYPLSRSAIETAVRLVKSSTSGGQASADALARAAESQMGGQLARFARRTRSRSRMADLVLTENTREQVHELLTAVRRRTVVMDRWGLAERHATGRGIVALFNGPPGTGKTMTASALANELDLPLYRIDVSSIVDRFVGETEKNLVRMFEEAAACRAALLFDEADSNDRRAQMANIGAKADKIVEKKGGNTDVSDAMLWAATILETQSFLAIALDAGAAAQKTVGKVDGEVTAHRKSPWGMLRHAYTGDNTPLSEGTSGPDIMVLKQMRQLTDWWMHGAEQLKETIDGVAGSQATPTLASAGYTGEA